MIKSIEQSVFNEYEIIVVDDHCSDKTADIVGRLALEYKNIRLVKNNHEAGFANALKAGFSSINAEVVVPVMADLCDDLFTIEKMLNKIDQGYDLVCAARYMKGGKRLGGSRLKAFLSRWGGKSLHYLLGIPTHDIANSFKMYKKAVIDSINIESRYFEVSMELVLKAYFLGFKITEVPTAWKERTQGRSTFRVFKLLPSYLKLYFWAVLMKIRSFWCRYFR
jgi:glycosyltransferase involved in cell wall biosynthesis